MTFSQYTFTVDNSTTDWSNVWTTPSGTVPSGGVIEFNSPTVSMPKLRPKTSLELLDDRINEVRRMVAV